MRSARLRFPSNINLLVKRATFRLLYFASGTSGRRTTLLRLGTICLLINELVWFSTVPAHGHQKRRRCDCGEFILTISRTPTRGCLSTFFVEDTRLSPHQNDYVHRSIDDACIVVLVVPCVTPTCLTDILRWYR